MRARHSTVVRGLLSAILAMAVGPAARADEPAKAPSPELEPGQVIGIVLEALAHPDRPRPDAGIEQTFRFASPANKAQTGPLPRFIRLVKHPRYAPLLGHERAIRGELQRESDGEVWQRVRVIAADGTQAVYVFVLSRQSGKPCDGCWMTDAVIRTEPEGLDT